MSTKFDTSEMPGQRLFMASSNREILYSGAFGVGKCVHYSTEVLLSNGSKKQVANIEPGEFVCSIASPDLPVVIPARVNARVFVGKKSAYKFTIAGGKSIIVSKNHPFLSLSLVNRPKEPGDITWKQAKDLSISNYIAIPNVSCIPDTTTEEPYDYELMGYLIGDGSLRQHSIEFTNFEPSAIDRIKELIPEDIKLTSSRRNHYRLVAISKFTDKRGIPTRTSIQTLVDSWGLTGKTSGEKFLPSFVFLSGEECLRGLLSGLFITDGWVDTRGIGFTSVSKQLVQDISHVLDLLGIHHIYRERTGKYNNQVYLSYSITISRLDQLKKFQSKVNMGFKSNKLAELIMLKELKSKPLRGVNSSYTIGHITFYPIKSIEYLGFQSMYDLEIETTANFIGNGFVVHNSRVGCEKGLHLSLAYPGNVGLVIRKTFHSLRQTTMETWSRYVCPVELMDGTINQITNILKLINGSKIVFSGLDDPLKLGSFEAGWIFVDEAIEITEEDYIMLLGRLRLSILIDNTGKHRSLPVRQIFSATNPASPSHWLYQRAYKQGEMKIFEGNTLANVHTPKDYKDSLARFKGIYKERYVLGKWVGASGVVYDCYDPKEHLIDKFEIPSDWKRYRGIDFGYTNPLSCIWIAEHPQLDDDAKCECPAPVHAGYYIYREIFMSKRTIEEHAGDIKFHNNQENITYTFADWAAGDRATLELHGVPTIKAVKDVSAGIQTVFLLFANKLLHIMKDCLVERDYTLENDRGIRQPQSIEDEILVYRYRDAPVGRQSTITNAKEEPLDKDGHSLDAIRYILHTLSLQGSFSTNVVSKQQIPTFDEFKPISWHVEGIMTPSDAIGRSKWSGL